MTELKWCVDWHLGINSLDSHHTKMLQVINEIIQLTDIKSDKNQPVNMFDTVVNITAAKQYFDIKRLNVLVDELFLPIICNLKNEILAYFSNLETAMEFHAMDSQYQFYKKDLIMLMTEIKFYINHVREENTLDSYSARQMKIWFMMHMRCLNKMILNLNQLQNSRQLLGAL